MRTIYTITSKVIFLFLGISHFLCAQETEDRVYENFYTPQHIQCDWLSLDRLSVGAEALYWKATEDNLGFGFNQHESVEVDSTTLDILTESSITKNELDFDWKPGFRLNIGYLLPCEGWDVGFTWTHLYSTAKGNANAPDRSEALPGQVTNTLSTTFLLSDSILFPNIFVNHIDANWQLTFNNFEWLIGRCVDLSCFTMNPYAGLKLTNIEQKYHLNYVLDPTDDGLVFGTIEQQIKTCYSGFGFQAGANAGWNIGCGFSLLSNLGGGITYGRAKICETLNSIETIPDESSQIVRTTLTDTAHVARPNLDLGVGIKWCQCYCDWYILTLNAGWEYHHYFDQNFLRYAQEDDPAGGDLSMYGATLGFSLEF